MIYNGIHSLIKRNDAMGNAYIIFIIGRWPTVYRNNAAHEN